MDHRKFRRIVAQVAELTAAQKRKLAAALEKHESGATAQIDAAFAPAPKCPKCGSDHVRRNGTARGTQRYQCVDCKRTFNALTGTPLSHLRRRDAWLDFAESLGKAESVRKAAARAGIDPSTSFRWRHRFLGAQKGLQDQRLSGIVEVDTSYVLESRKGERKLPRKARKRGGKAKKRGLSDEQIPILIARDRDRRHIDAVVPDRTADAVDKVLGTALDPADALLCTDGDAALIAFAERRGIEYETIIASRGEHVHEGVLHIQNVNSYASRFKGWLAPFRGVATRYLPSYLAWRRLLERAGDAFAPGPCLVNAIG